MSELDELDEEEEIGSGIKGKKAELTVIGDLLDSGFQVYTPTVDLGVDCIVDLRFGNAELREIQIKYREKQAVFRARAFKPRPQLFVICCLGEKNDYWCIPSQKFYELSKHQKMKKREYYQLTLSADNKRKLAEYHHNYESLMSIDNGSAPKRTPRQTQHIRIDEPHATRSELIRGILTVLSDSNEPLKTLQIITFLGDELGSTLTDTDWEKTRADRTPRWEKNARFTIYQHLKPAGLIEAKSKNQWVITEKGKKHLEGMK